MKSYKQYSLVHMCTSGEYKTPLVSSQLFDQAQWQASTKGAGAPAQVEAWAIEPLRELFKNSSRIQLKKLRIRCPDTNIKIIGGISRFNGFPILDILKYRRRKLNLGNPVIYHCRGEAVIKWAIRLRELFPQDKIHLDVRGYWPEELLYKRGILSIKELKEKDNKDYNSALERLRFAIKNADSISTVSQNLRDLIIAEANAPLSTYVVPCCISRVQNDIKRKEVRQKWGIKEFEKVLIYSGGIAKYQHLEDMTLPLVNALMELNQNIKLVFLTTEVEGMKKILNNSGIDLARTIIDTAPQKEVAIKLTGADAGLLIRRPTIVNKVAHPVKINEYLASGLSIISENGLGGISEELIDQNVVNIIELDKYLGNIHKLKSISDWIFSLGDAHRDNARRIVEKNYLWKSAINIHRNEYQKLLSQKSINNI